MGARRWAVVLSVALVAYLGFAVLRGVELVRAGGAVAVGLGLGVLVLPLIGAWLLWREWRFGLAMQQMGQALGAQGGLPADDLPRAPSGRVVRDAADAAFERCRAQVVAAPEDWRAWYRLAIAYDDARDRRRARASMRQAWARYQRPGPATQGPAGPSDSPGAPIR